MLISELDRYLFHEGTHVAPYQFLGAHVVAGGVHFATWAPHANSVAVVGDFNNWDGSAHQMKKISPQGIWTLFVTDLPPYSIYKYEIFSSYLGRLIKADPYARHCEVRPNTASIVYPQLDYQWSDDSWLKARAAGNVMETPISIYEVNLLSWKKPADGCYSYRQLAEQLIPHVVENGFTHIELMPIMEHPFDGSWGYQITGFYAATSRYGTPDDFKYFVDCCHAAGLGVILDWVPGHFCKDEHGLAFYDGEPLYEPCDQNLRENLSWGTMNFNYDCPEVRSFLIGNANYWLTEYHIDGLRIDAVAYMLYKHMATARYDLYTEKDINQAAVQFIKQLNRTLFGLHKNILMMAEESSAYPLVSAPVHDGGLGFNYKWNMGWMHDTLKYMESDPLARQHAQDKLTFSIYYAFNENFVLPLSHDEVVHGKRALVDKMPGDYWQKFANLRLLIAYQFFHPGKKLNFMGNEFAQFIEWNEWDQLDWHLYDYDSHRAFNCYFKKLNALYRAQPALYQVDHHHAGFKWIEFDNHKESIIAFMRCDKTAKYLIAVFNFTPVVREKYPIKVPQDGVYREMFNSDATEFYGSGVVNDGPLGAHKRADDYYIELTLPPLGALLIKLDKAKIDIDNTQNRGRTLAELTDEKEVAYD
ncbi:MAG: 1,4-alpha-glucan branching enzyme [Clostridiales bacterium]|nr:MAG: 1,4-alpha-glucan branching enzyme [Clostridiales bacterium]